MSGESTGNGSGSSGGTSSTMGLGKGGDLSKMLLKGPQQQNIGAGLSAVTKAKGATGDRWKDLSSEEYAAAPRMADAVRRAGAAANALSRAQAARGVAAARGSGIATGGGLGAASGSMAVQSMREQIAGAAKTEADAQKAEMDARYAAHGLSQRMLDARESAAQAGLEEAIGLSEIAGASQAQIASSMEQASLVLGRYEADEIPESSASAELAGFMKALDLSQDEDGNWNSPDQVTSAIGMAGAALASFTGSNLPVPEEIWHQLLKKHGTGVVQLFSGSTNATNLENFLDIMAETYQELYGSGTGLPEAAWSLAGVDPWTADSDYDDTAEGWVEAMYDKYEGGGF